MRWTTRRLRSKPGHWSTYGHWKVLWVGNMIQAPSPSLPWLLEGRHKETIAILARVREFLPEDATIIPGHGRPMRPPDIKFPLRYLREFDAAVSAALDEGRSVEATLETVRMPDYREYNLFEWAHNSIHVPAAYRRLQDLRAATAQEEQPCRWAKPAKTPDIDPLSVGQRVRGRRGQGNARPNSDANPTPRGGLRSAGSAADHALALSALRDGGGRAHLRPRSTRGRARSAARGPRAPSA
jgi:hypothetical protein